MENHKASPVSSASRGDPATIRPAFDKVLAAINDSDYLSPFEKTDDDIDQSGASVFLEGGTVSTGTQTFDVGIRIDITGLGVEMFLTTNQGNGANSAAFLKALRGVPGLEFDARFKPPAGEIGYGCWLTDTFDALDDTSYGHFQDVLEGLAKNFRDYQAAH